MTKIIAEINPFIVPDYVTLKQQPGLRQDGLRDPVKVQLKYVSEEALQELIDNFSKAIFEKRKEQ